MTLAALASGGIVICALVGLAAVGLAVAGLRRGRGFWPAAVLLVVCLGASLGLWTVRANDAGVQACGAELRRLGSALELYGQNNGAPPETLNELIPTYFTELPACPAARAKGEDGGYREGYERSDDGFKVVCRGRHHAGPGGAPEDHPRFTSAEGLVDRS